MSARPRAVHQVLATLSYGDAIGNEALAIRGHLRRAGFGSDIFAETVHPRMVGEARSLPEYADLASSDTVCLFHFAVGSAAGPLVHHTPGRLVLVYHNITPAEHFLGYQNHLFGLCYHGRRGLAAFAPRAELALGKSEFSRRELAAAGFARTGVLPIVLDFERYRGPGSPVVRRIYDDGRTNLLAVGRVIPNKKIEDVLRAFALYQRYLDRRSRLLLVGDYAACPNYYDALVALAGDLRLKDVVFAGHVDDEDLRAYYQVADALVCLSEHEGYCVPLVEAMAFGVPVVAYDAGAVAETLGGAGVLLAAKQPELVAGVVDGLVHDAAVRRAVVVGQNDRVAALSATDFGALLLDRLAPLLGEVA